MAYLSARTCFCCLSMLFWLAFAGQANAQAHLHETFKLSLQNQTKQNLRVAWVYQNTVQDDWVSEGWLELAPGQITVLELEGGCPPSVGIYAKAEDGTVVLEGNDSKFAAMLDHGRDFSFMLKRRNFTPTATLICFRKLGVHHSSSSYKYTFK